MQVCDLETVLTIERARAEEAEKATARAERCMKQAVKEARCDAHMLAVLDGPNSIIRPLSCTSFLQLRRCSLQSMASHWDALCMIAVSQTGTQGGALSRTHSKGMTD